MPRVQDVQEPIIICFLVSLLFLPILGVGHPNLQLQLEVNPRMVREEDEIGNWKVSVREELAIVIVHVVVRNFNSVIRVEEIFHTGENSFVEKGQS